MVYFKNKHEEILEVNVKPKQKIEDLVLNIEDLGSMKRVRINKLNYCCQYSRDIEEILVQDIDAEVIFQTIPRAQI